ncbi:MAG: methyltransferase domain-containing protein, partial [Gammaproteobacteria bacterium]|nr:methyltransferase domain-containing protein [Gammaproteobacteria bacterium]
GCDVLGVDSSEKMVIAARDHGVEANVLDASALYFDNEFDAVFSNAVLHWVLKPDAVITGVRRALKNNGRFVGEFGGSGNVDILRRAMHQALIERGVDPDRVDPWYFPKLEDYQSKLEQNGFEVQYIELIDRPTPLPTGIRGWMESFAGSFVFALPEADREQFMEDVTERVGERLCREGQYFADYVRLRFAAQKIMRSED